MKALGDASERRITAVDFHWTTSIFEGERASNAWEGNGDEPAGVGTTGSVWRDSSPAAASGGFVSEWPHAPQKASPLIASTPQFGQKR